MKRVKILLADDHLLALQSIGELLKKEYQIVGQIQDGNRVVPAVKRLLPDLLLLDISMPNVNGLDAARQVRQILPRVKIIFVTMHTEPIMIMEAFRIGALGYVLKHSAASELLSAIQAVLRHGWFLSSQIVGDIREKILIQIEGMPLDDLSGRLTDRQRSVLELIASGKSARQIATTLNISLSTVAFHKTNIIQALGMRSSAELTKFALNRGLTTL